MSHFESRPNATYGTPKVHPRCQPATYPFMSKTRPYKLPQRRVFSLFPDFPFEIRLMIFERAIPEPRFVELKLTQVTRRQYSDAAIPALLQTSSESRKAMITLGYQLAFGNDNQAPQTWFNFSHDFLHLTNPLVNEITVNYYRWMSHLYDYAAGLTVTHQDMVCVKKLAVSATLWDGYDDGQSKARPRDLVKMFGHLKELLIVENVWDEGGRLVQEPQGSWGYGNAQEFLELDYADIAENHATKHEPTDKYYSCIMRYMKDNDSNGKSYFHHIADVFRKELAAAAVSSSIRTGRNWSTPDVKVVRLVGSSEVQYIKDIRDEYWRRVGALEKAMNKSWLKPWDPFTSHYADDIEAFEEVYREERVEQRRKTVSGYVVEKSVKREHLRSFSTPHASATDNSKTSFAVRKKDGYKGFGVRGLTLRLKQRS